MNPSATNSVINQVTNKYSNKKENLLQILREINNKEGYISKEAITEVAKILNINPTEIYGVATFYSFLNIKPKGKYIIKICKSISCDRANCDEIKSTLENELGIRFGQTTQDNKFSLEYTNCIGMCDRAPAMLVNDDLYDKLTIEKILELIKKLKKQNK